MAAIAPFIIAGAASILGSGIQAYAQGKISKEQLALEAKRLGLEERQLDLLIDQTLRQNRIQSHNMARVNPMLDKMLARQTEMMGRTPQYMRLRPPRVNNPYQPGFANPAPPRMDVPGVSQQLMAESPSTMDPRKLAEKVMRNPNVIVNLRG